eukprot:6195546-Pleurochrysis_carterae.AAC.2
MARYIAEPYKATYSPLSRQLHPPVMCTASALPAQLEAVECVRQRRLVVGRAHLREGGQLDPSTRLTPRPRPTSALLSLLSPRRLFEPLSPPVGSFKSPFFPSAVTTTTTSMYSKSADSFGALCGTDWIGDDEEGGNSHPSRNVAIECHSGSHDSRFKRTTADKTSMDAPRQTSAKSLRAAPTLESTRSKAT